MIVYVEKNVKYIFFIICLICFQVFVFGVYCNVYYYLYNMKIIVLK